jgi:hypothetical protein
MLRLQQQQQKVLMQQAFSRPVLLYKTWSLQHRPWQGWEGSSLGGDIHLEIMMVRVMRSWMMLMRTMSCLAAAGA